ncbi:hypothetical protein [Streptomyces sp. NPDC058291]|uniref:hypothetical protein n=1 Tax=Streptomyces sp. NPDC058291 TaxID=3346427 RepID=UPI0036ED0C56
MSARGSRTTGDGGAGHALRRFQERFEPTVTRVLLIGIFVTGLTAQFVKPVGDALAGMVYLGGALLGLVDPKGYRTDLNVWSPEGTDDAGAAIAAWNKHHGLEQAPRRPVEPGRAAPLA